MIEILIKSDGENILDKFDHKDCTLDEVGVVLLRLKQIEHELIQKQFQDDILIRKDYKDEDTRDEEDEKNEDDEEVKKS